jgi:hypothetical protein
MRIWQFFDYSPEGGGCPITEWYEVQEAAVRAAFDATVEDLAATEEWNDSPSFGTLDRNPAHAGLSEVRFYAFQNNRKINYRAIGRLRGEAREFIFFVGLAKSGRVTIPPDALLEAARLLRQLEQGRGEINAHFQEENDMAENGEGPQIP